MKKFIYIFLFFPLLLAAQQNLPLNREWGLDYEQRKAHITSDSVKELTVTDHTVIAYPQDLSCFKPYMVYPEIPVKGKSRWSLVRKLRQESLLNVRDTTDKFYLRLDPLFNFEYGRDLADTSGETLYKNTRGFIVRGSVGNKFAFESSFYENQATFASYIDDYIIATDNLFQQSTNDNFNYNVVPGQGRSKPFKKNGYDYAMSSGYISYSPNKVFNLQVGHGKHFIGDGYRSLLLSDNSFNYPYARITTAWKNIQYTNLYTSFMNLTSGGARSPKGTERLFQKKVGSFQLLSMNFLRRMQIGLFQGMIWETADTNNRQHLSFNTFDPIIGVNTAIYGLNDKNNIVIGGTLKLKITRSIQVYGQYMLDDAVKKGGLELRRKFGYQAGLKLYLPVPGLLCLQAEYNSVRPYAYASDDPEQSYTHYNQTLAHPLGANFTELVGILNYQYKGFFIELKFNYAQKGVDSLNYNAGSNVFASSNTFPIAQDISQVKMLQGERVNITYEDVHLGYLVNPATNFNVFIGVSNRSEARAIVTRNTQFVYFGIRTSLANFYYDF